MLAVMVTCSPTPRALHEVSKSQQPRSQVHLHLRNDCCGLKPPLSGDCRQTLIVDRRPSRLSQLSPIKSLAGCSVSPLIALHVSDRVSAHCTLSGSTLAVLCHLCDSDSALLNCFLSCFTRNRTLRPRSRGGACRKQGK